MIVTSVSYIMDTYLDMFRTTEIKVLQDEETKKVIQEITQRTEVDLYNDKGKIETWRG